MTLCSRMVYMVAPHTTSSSDVLLCSRPLTQLASSSDVLVFTQQATRVA